MSKAGNFGQFTVPKYNGVVKMHDAVKMLEIKIKSNFTTSTTRRNTPFLVGLSGIGKTMVIYDLAKEIGAQIYLMNMTSKKEGDVVGIPLVVGDKVIFIPVHSIRSVSDVDAQNQIYLEALGKYLDKSATATLEELKNKALVFIQENLFEGFYAEVNSEIRDAHFAKVGATYKPVILFLDEFNRADLAVIQETMTLLTEGIVGDFELSKDTMVVGALNPDLPELGYKVTKLDHAHLGRMHTIPIITPTFVDWKDWAIDRGVHDAIISFLDEKREYMIGSIKEDGLGTIYVSPREWSSLSRDLFVIDEDFPKNDDGGTNTDREKYYKYTIDSKFGHTISGEFNTHVMMYWRNKLEVRDILNSKAKVLTTEFAAKLKEVKNSMIAALFVNRFAKLIRDDVVSLSESENLVFRLHDFLTQITKDMNYTFFSILRENKSSDNFRWIVKVRRNSNDSELQRVAAKIIAMWGEDIIGNITGRGN